MQSDLQCNPVVIQNWLREYTAPVVHRAAYFGYSAFLREQVALMRGTEAFRALVARVEGRHVDDPVIPLVIPITRAQIQASPFLASCAIETDSSPGLRLSALGAKRRDAFYSASGPYKQTPLQLARLSGSTECEAILAAQSSPVEEKHHGPIAGMARLNQAAEAWAEELQLKAGSARQVSQFTSRLDPLLKKYLGDLFATNVAKVVIGARRYVLIADRHTRLPFRNLVGALLDRVDKTPKSTPTAMFVECILRDPIMERAEFRDHLGRKPVGYLFGMESRIAVPIGYANHVTEIRQGTIKSDNTQVGVLYGLMQHPVKIEIWDRLKTRKRAQRLTAMMDTVEECAELAKKDVVKGVLALKSVPFYSKAALWLQLFEELMRASAELPWIPSSLATRMVELLDHPGSEQAERFHKEFTLDLRESFMVENLDTTLRVLPKSTDTVLFVGWLHMKGIISGLVKRAQQEQWGSLSNPPDAIPGQTWASRPPPSVIPSTRKQNCNDLMKEILKRALKSGWIKVFSARMQPGDTGPASKNSEGRCNALIRILSSLAGVASRVFHGRSA